MLLDRRRGRRARQALAEHAHDVRGLALMGANKFNEAVIAYNEALAIDPNNVSAHCNLGSALLADHKYPAALEHLNRALEFKSLTAHAAHPDELGTVRSIAFHLFGIFLSFFIQIQVSLG